MTGHVILIILMKPPVVFQYLHSKECRGEIPVHVHSQTWSTEINSRHCITLHYLDGYLEQRNVWNYSNLDWQKVNIEAFPDNIERW